MTVHDPEYVPVLDSGYVRLIEGWGFGEADEAEAAIIEAARQSTQGSFRGWDIWECNVCKTRLDSKQTHGDCPANKGWSNDQKLLSFLYNSNHSTPFEFAGAVFEVQAPIFVFREWHRHRTQSYNEMSARYAPLPNLKYMPTLDRVQNISTDNKQAGTVSGETCSSEDAMNFLDTVSYVYQIIENEYREALAKNVPKELARVILPVGQYSRMRASANLRNWIGFLNLRMDNRAQYEIRQYANAVHSILLAKFPRTMALFGDGREDNAER